MACAFWLKLSLATPTVLGQRRQAISDEIQRRQAQARDAFTDGYRRTHGIGVA